MENLNITPGTWHVKQTASNSIAVKSDDTLMVLVEAIINSDDKTDENMFEAKANCTIMAASPLLAEYLDRLVTAHENDNTKEYGYLCEVSRKLLDTLI